jgi:hypothetical protein
MTDRERLLEILNVPIYPHENVDPLEAVADYLPNGRGNHATNWAECSECRVCGSPQWKVCPVCETKMEDT